MTSDTVERIHIYVDGLHETATLCGITGASRIANATDTLSVPVEKLCAECVDRWRLLKNAVADSVRAEIRPGQFQHADETPKKPN
jgi:hypothetical protein